MAPFRGSDETLDREIEVLEGIARGRLRRYTRDLADLERDLRALKVERAKRKALGSVPVRASVVVTEAAES